jgi:hypothetical protein
MNKEPTHMAKPQHMIVGRGIRELPETRAQSYAARQARRHREELERKDREIAELREQAAKDRHVKARLAVTALINERTVAKTEVQRSKLFNAVERERQAHVAKGGGAPFNAIESVKRHEHLLGFNPIAPASLAGNVLERGLPVPGGRTGGDGDAAERDEQLRSASERGRLAAEHARASTEAYTKRLRELGLDIPGQGTAGDYRRM